MPPLELANLKRKPICLLDIQTSRTEISPRQSARIWAQVLQDYRTPDNWRATIELLITIVPFIAIWLLILAAVEHGYWGGLLLAVPAAGFLLRLFMIQHDCGHGSFFHQKRANDWTGRIIGVLTLTPYGLWRRTHAIHHAGSGNLDRRGIGDVDTLTVAEYRARSPWQRAKYRIYRHPLVLFGIGPAYLFILQHRLPIGMMREGHRPWSSAVGTNLAILLAIVIIGNFVSFSTFALVHLPVVLIAATAGVWLFFIQHQFEGTTWESHPDWAWQEAALHGSSYLDLPAIIRWFTANIGMHHVHHLCSRIPFYRLPQVLGDHPELGGINRITLLESVHCMNLALWDEVEGRLVSFREAKPLP